MRAVVPRGRSTIAVLALASAVVMAALPGQPSDAATKKATPAKKTATKKASSSSASTPIGSSSGLPQCGFTAQGWLLSKLLAENTVLSLDRNVQQDLRTFNPASPESSASATLATLNAMVTGNAAQIVRPLNDTLYVIELVNYLASHPLEANASPDQESFSIGAEPPHEILIGTPLDVDPESLRTCLASTSLGSAPSAAASNIEWTIPIGDELVAPAKGTTSQAGLAPFVLNTGHETEEEALGDLISEPAVASGTYDTTKTKTELSTRLPATRDKVRAALQISVPSAIAVSDYDRVLASELTIFENDAKRAIDALQIKAEVRMIIDHHVPKSKKKTTTKPTKPTPKPKPRKGPQAGVGDPHFLSVDGGNVEYQGAGEYDLVVSSTKDLRIQVRLEPTAPDANVSVMTAIAARIDGHRVVVSSRPTLRVTFDGAPITSSRAAVSIDGDSVDLRWKDGSELAIVTAAGTSLDEHFTPADARFNKLAGLGGDWDGKAGNDYRTRAGKVVDTNDLKAVYDAFGSSWRIGAKDSLFDYAAGQSTATFTLPAYPADRDPFKTHVSSDAIDAATATCQQAGVNDARLLIDCVYDVALTGDAAFAARFADMARRLAASAPAAPAVIDNSPIVAFGATGTFDRNNTTWKLKVTTAPTDVTDRANDPAPQPGSRLIAVGVVITNGGKASAQPWPSFDGPRFTLPGSTDELLANSSGNPVTGLDECQRPERAPIAAGASITCSLTVWVPAGTKTSAATLVLSGEVGDRTRFRLS